ncbi:MAG: UDP-N-acetylmuramyl-tripeptide synthetase, partial [Planctomycetes bacterium]|nr:UDP-N-acetylmuramyl-tripeptide synthetase [Planctomycetota bacterium]
MKDSDGSAIDVRTHTLQTLWCRAGLALAYPPGIPTDAVITSLTDDSRRVGPGSLFVAVRGTNCDGHRYIEQAVLAGAAAVVVEQDAKTFGNATYLRVQDSRAALARLAAAFYGLYERPADKLKLIGVTGTNGKTTVAWMLRSILQAAGEKAALLGTIEYDLIGDRVVASLTTPGPVDLCRYLSAAAAAGARYAVIEVSSHALDQRRTEGLRWAVGVFTNLSGDHLDYHGSMDAYAAAKRRLFEQLDSHATAVVNGDDPATASVTATTRASISRFGLNGGVCEVGATIESMTASGSQFVIRFEDGAVPVRIGLVGRHNISNALAAAAAGRALGLSPEAVRLGLDSLRGVPGRLQRIAPEESPFSVLVDYAHTDD